MFQLGPLTTKSPSPHSCGSRKVSLPLLLRSSLSLITMRFFFLCRPPGDTFSDMFGECFEDTESRCRPGAVLRAKGWLMVTGSSGLLESCSLSFSSWLGSSFTSDSLEPPSNQSSRFYLRCSGTGLRLDAASISSTFNGGEFRTWYVGSLA